MLWTIVVVLLILWALGFFLVPTIGSLVHILLVLALIGIVYNLVVSRGRAV